MDARRFDHLTRALTEAGSRRDLLRMLAALPLFGSLAVLLAEDEVDAKGRRKRRKKPHHHRKKTGNRSGTQKKRRCIPESKATSCKGQCGSVSNNCQKRVDCGSCDCPDPCDECFLCQDQGPNTPAQCVPDPEQVGEPCGSDGQLCQDDGACECQAGSCANPTPICADGECVPCSEARPCPSGCCTAHGACDGGGQNSACGFPGEQCRDCTATGDVCSDRACRCDSGVTCAADGCCPSASDVCDGDNQCCSPASPCAGLCGTVTDNCGQSITCDPCPPQITAFTATPDTIDRGADPPETTALLSWSTSDATTCTLDDGSGPVTVNCNASQEVEPSSTTPYTLSASGVGGGPDTAQATVTVEYCHAITRNGGDCPNASEYCQGTPIVATSSDNAKAACEACFGAGACLASHAGGGLFWGHAPTGTTFIYKSATLPSLCGGNPPPFPVAGEIATASRFCPFSRWAP